MATIKNLEKVWGAPYGTPVTVGNNRQIQRVRGGAFECFLHGSRVAVIDPCGTDSSMARVYLDTCGYATNTTRAAMKDFMGAFGVKGSASLAGGKLSARYHNGTAWRDIESEDGARLSFIAPRY